jgi:hypothetical protein
MKDTFSNRLAMFKTSGNTLFDPKWKSVWEGKPPLIFGTKAAAAVEATDDLEEFCRQQGVVVVTGEDLHREEAELENAAHLLARALVNYHRDRNNESEASKFDFPISWWRRLRNTELLTNAETVRVAVAALAVTSSAEAEPYGLTAAAAASLKKEWNDYDALVTKPRQVVGDRKVLTDQLRTRFSAMEAKFDSLDDLAGQFSATPEGRDFVSAYRIARVVVDRGGRAAAEKPGTPVSA